MSIEATLETSATADWLGLHGARVLIAGADATGATSLPAIASHPVVEPLLAIQSFYRMANELALARGLDPDRPPHLHKVTETV